MSTPKSPDALEVYNSKSFWQHLREQKGSAAKRGYFRFAGAWDKGTMAYMECQGRTAFNVMETSLWHQALRQCLGSHDRQDPIEDCCNAMVCHEQTTRLHMLSCSKPEWSALIHLRRIWSAVV